MKLKAPETVFSSAGFCPGCGHGLATRLIGEVSEELGIQEKMLAVVDVACCSFNIDYWRYDTIMAAHGRDIPTAVGVKHIRPANPVFAYLGDGAAYSIGMAETVHAALRNDNICVFVQFIRGNNDSWSSLRITRVCGVALGVGNVKNISSLRRDVLIHVICHYFLPPITAIAHFCLSSNHHEHCSVTQKTGCVPIFTVLFSSTTVLVVRRGQILFCSIF